MSLASFPNDVMLGRNAAKSRTRILDEDPEIQMNSRNFDE